MLGKQADNIKVKVLEAAGGTAALADALGISSQAISQWEKVPAQRVGQVATLTGMTYAEIRPDLFQERATA